MNKIVVIFIAFSLIGGAAAEESVAPFSLRVEEVAFSSELSSPVERRDKIVNLYRSEFGGVISVGDVDSLRRRLDAALSAAFYSKDRSVAREAAMIYRVLAAKSALRSDDAEDVIASLIKVREFDWANNFLVESQLPVLPLVQESSQVEGAAGPRIMVLSVEGLRVNRVDEDRIRNGVIVVSNPLCAFSSAASDAIVEDSSLANALIDALWLVPQEGSLHYHQLERWNRTHRSQQMVLAYDWVEWPALDDWSTPTFYFFAGGRLVEKVSGWPIDGGRASRLREAIENWKKAKADL